MKRRLLINLAISLFLILLSYLGISYLSHRSNEKRPEAVRAYWEQYRHELESYRSGEGELPRFFSARPHVEKVEDVTFFELYQKPVPMGLVHSPKGPLGPGEEWERVKELKGQGQGHFQMQPLAPPWYFYSIEE